MLRKLSYTIASLLMLVSCVEDEIGEIMHDNNGQYIMSAIVTDADSIAEISIKQVKNYITVPVFDAEVDVLVNGQKRHTISPVVYQNYYGKSFVYYKFHPEYLPGDEVEFVAHIGDKRLSATSRCPQPVEILAIDTIPYTIDYSGYSQDNLYRLAIHLRKPAGASPSGNYYRLEVRRKITQVIQTIVHYNYDSLESDSVKYLFGSYVQKQYSYKKDVALNGGNVDIGDDALISFFDQQPNLFGIFTDDYFSGDTYTLLVDVAREDCWETEYQCIVSSISSDEYYFLKSYCAISEDSEISDGAPVLCSNVSGGEGFVGVECASVASFTVAPHYNQSQEVYY